MKSAILKIILFSLVFIQAGCEITFKKKSNQGVTPSTEQDEEGRHIPQNDEVKTTPFSTAGFNNNDTQLITSFYSNANNAVVRKDMISHTQLSKRQDNNIRVNKIIPRDVQVVPLPLNLETSLSPIALHQLRVQIGKYVVVMNVKSRLIVAIIKI